MNTTESAACQGFLLLAILAATVGCAGKKIDSPTVGPMTVQLSPSSSAVNPGERQQFTATVLGSSNQGVTWAVDSAGPGNSTTGAVTATGLYTAPALAGTHTVTATSVADPTKSATATVTVQGAISVAPSTVALSLGAQQQFTATVVGSSNQMLLGP